MSIHFHCVMPRGKTKPKQEIVVIDDKLCMTTCNNCSKRNISIAYFAPKPSNSNIKQFDKFVKACDNGDCKEILASGFCSKNCKQCRETNSESQKKIDNGGKYSQLNNMAAKIKEDMQRKGCKICGCFDIERLEADHPNRENKIQKVQNARNWTSADEMWNEYMKCDVLCSSCHSLQDSHNGARGANSAEMPKGENSHSKEYHAKYARENKEKMQAYNRKRKREMKECQMCHSEVLEGTEMAFHWAHRDERTKVAAVSKLCENTYNEKNIKKIDDEIEKCDLLCSGCHKQFQTQEHFKDYLPIWEELIERGVPKPKDWDSWQQKA